MKKLIFCHFLMYELQNGFKMSLKPKNNYANVVVVIAVVDPRHLPLKFGENEVINR